ncbi:MAG: peroxiredoxin-like family protein [Planctomycetota bacterium]
MRRTSTAADGLEPAPAWMSWVLYFAATYNVLWGVATLFVSPSDVLPVEGSPTQTALWQCIGMIVGAYGIGYAAAAFDPYRHWPVTLVGLVGKILGPIGFVVYASKGVLPWTMGLTILTNDLAWWVPFTLILWGSFRAHTGRVANPGRQTEPEFADAIDSVRSSNGESLAELSDGQDAAVLFLRHSGCTFCREAASDLARTRDEIERSGTRLALVTMSSPADAKTFLKKYSLDDLPIFSDPDRVLYRAFELRRGRLGQLFGATSWSRGASAFFRGHGIGAMDGDGFQMPGLFLLRDGEIVKAYRHETAADRPDYAAFACTAAEPDAVPEPAEEPAHVG